MSLAWNKHDAGCWADGALGHDHVRARLAILVAQVWTAEMLDKYGYDVAEALDCEMSDDAGEEQDALDIIQEFTESGVTWQFADGDLMLLADPEESAE
jgi:hypothetical protein